MRSNCCATLDKDLCKTVLHIKVNVSQLQDMLRLPYQNCLCRSLTLDKCNQLLCNSFRRSCCCTYYCHPAPP
ncbi:hypothetical protein PROFUN_13262 [Planoprotostelium fungivorum]|uniref:Uncharacterized protein n=1 Tax=Planoprotostelium fungivorum TaxID=1890364 RepID=A0A2P6N4Y4_9EUKA|nr:hypothetical protein PROFUN_13262 [Planoprotostelium fungivorum]